MKQLQTDMGSWTRSEFINYLEMTLIPDLIESGSEGHTHDYQLAVRFLRDEDREGLGSGCISDTTQAIFGFGVKGTAVTGSARNNPCAPRDPSSLYEDDLDGLPKKEN